MDNDNQLLILHHVHLRMTLDKLYKLFDLESLDRYFADKVHRSWHCLGSIQLNMCKTKLMLHPAVNMNDLKDTVGIGH
jgi:hypothetical protein